jgi:hypothetical protein
MLNETLSASDVVSEVFRESNDVCEVIECGEKVLMVSHTALFLENAIGIPQSLRDRQEPRQRRNDHAESEFCQLRWCE